MQPLESDILEFIHDCFEPAAHPSVLDLLGVPVLETARLQRAVLYLSDGSLSMLKHYIECARHDACGVVERAEYVLGIVESPWRIRDCALPMPSGRFPAAPLSRQPAAAQPAGPAPAGQPPSDPARCHHRRRTRMRINVEDLRGARFSLGEASYVVLEEPGERLLVRCARRCENVISIMRLPLIFVMEQLSEHIELVDAEAAEW